MRSFQESSAKVAVDELRALATPPAERQGDAIILPTTGSPCKPMPANAAVDAYILGVASVASVMQQQPASGKLPKRIADSVPFTTSLDAFVASPTDGDFDFAVAYRSAKRQLVRQRTTAAERQRNGTDADGDATYTDIHIALRRKSNLHIQYARKASKMPAGRMGKFAVDGGINPRTGQRSKRSSESIGDRMARRLPSFSALDDEARDVAADAYTYWRAVRRDGVPYSELLASKAKQIAGKDWQRLAIGMAVRAVVRRRAERYAIGRKAMVRYAENVKASTMARLPLDLPQDEFLSSVARALASGMTKKEAAKHLGVSRPTLYAAISRLRIAYRGASLTSHEHCAEYNGTASVSGTVAASWSERNGMAIRRITIRQEYQYDGSGI